MTPEERAVAFRAKKLPQRAAIVAAGPAANFIFGIALLAAIFGIYGQPRTLPLIGEVQAGSAAEAAGLKTGDKVLVANGETVATSRPFSASSASRSANRCGSRSNGTAGPDDHRAAAHHRDSDAFGEKQKVPILGVMQQPDATTIVKHGPISAIRAATVDVGQMVGTTLKGVGQMISGRRNSDQLSGPVGIAEQIGQAAHLGLAGVLIFAVYISINLGLVNLFPIPLLDGGHLLFYGVEAVLRRPLGRRVQEYGFRVRTGFGIGADDPRHRQRPGSLEIHQRRRFLMLV